MEDELVQLKMCELKAKGLMEEMDRRSNKPTVICGKCGVKANAAEHLHNPRPLAKKFSDGLWG